MLTKKLRQFWYLVVLIVFSVIAASAMSGVANYTFFDLAHSHFFNLLLGNTTTSKPAYVRSSNKNVIEKKANSSTSSLFYFTTIISNSDEEVFCTNDGTTLARFNLCGNFDNRIITLNQPYSTYEWQQLSTISCPSYNIDLNCPTYTCGGFWTTVSTASTFALNASSITALMGAEFRVRVDGGSYFYVKVKKSTITQTYVKRDYICGELGRIQATNLSSSYEYAINGGSGFGAWQGPIFDGLLPGTYILKARLKNTPNSCEYPYEPIVIQSREIDIDVTFVDAQCFGENGSILVQVNDVPGPYKYTLLDGNGFPQEFTTFIANSTYNFAAVGFGTYSVQVETQQCKGDAANGILAPSQDVDTSGNPIIIGDGLNALSASTEVNSSFGCSTITSVPIIVRTSGGLAPYTYTVNGNPTVSPAYAGQTIYTALASGDYNFLITDANGCTITAAANIKELSPPVVSTSGVNGTCTNGGAKIIFNVVNARGYNLSYRIQTTDPWIPTPQISVADGTYNSLEVRYQQGSFSCTMMLPPVTVTSEATINGTVTKLADEICDSGGCGGCQGGVVGTIGGRIQFGIVSGGSGSGYEYSVDGINFSSTPLFTNLAPGTYTPIIRDDSGCRLELTAIVINPVDPPSDIAFIQNNTNCALGIADLQLTPTSNYSIANYSIINPISLDNGSSNIFTGLSLAITYTFRITDSNDCIYEESFTPAVISSIRARVKSGGDKRVCNGASDGNGIFVIDGFGSNYTYQINSEPISAPQNATEVNLVSRVAGTYTITVTDVDTGCTDSATIVIEESATFNLVPAVTPMTCSNGSIGRVVANTTGGWGGNRYTLQYPNGTTVGPRTNRTFGNLIQTSTPLTPYVLTAVDSEGCTATYDFQLTPLSAPTIAIASANLCYEPISGAAVTVSATGGTPGYLYRINNGSFQASPTFLNLSPGTHAIQVRDSNNCTDTVTITINRQLRVSTTLETEIPCGGAPGAIRVNVTNGYLASLTPKQYQVSSDSGLTWGAMQAFTANSFLYSVTAGGDYIFRITDNEGCEAFSALLEVKDPINILATAELTPASCGDANSGGVRIVPDATSGIPPFEIDFGNTGTFTSQTVYTGLIGGQTYNYTVRDSRGCLTSGLSATIPTSLNTPPAADVTANDVVCSGFNSPPIQGVGTIQINNVTNGTPDFTYIVSDVFGTEIVRVGPTSSTSEIISHPNLVTGTYIVRTVDALGCSDLDTVTIAQTTLTVIADAIAPVCSVSGFSNTVEIFGGIGPNFLIRLVGDPSAPVTPNSPPRRHTFNGLQLGVTYTVEVTDLGTGCIYFDEIPPVDGATLLDVTATSPPVFCDNLGNGRADYTVTGFIGPIQIELINPLTNMVIATQSYGGASPFTSFFDTVPGNYLILVTDSDTCTDATTIDVILNPPAVDILSNIPANCNALGQLTVRGSGGDGGPYAYAFVPAGDTPLATDFSASNTAVLPGSLTGISYDIWVVDGRGCTFKVSHDVVLLQPNLPPPTIIVDNQCAASASSFNITATMPAWVDTPSFTLNGEQNFTGIFSVTTPGTYTVDVVDVSGCSGAGTAIVYEFLSGTGEFSALPICNNPDGTITVTTNGGSGDFTFELQDNLGNPIGGVPTNTTGIFTGQAPGAYLVLVTDNLVNDGIGFCTFSVPVNLDLPVPPIIATEIAENISCHGANDGSIAIALQAGSDADGPIDYILTNIATAVTVTNNTGVFNNLTPDDYQVEVVTSRNCSIVSSIITIVDPAIFEISAVSTPFTCEIGANRFSSSMITVTIDQVGTIGSGYQYSITGFENYQTSNTFEIIDDGTTQNITVYAVDANGCQDLFIVPAIAPPSEVQSVLTVESLLNCEDPETVRISVTGTLDFTIITTSATPVANVNNSGSNTYAEVNLPVAGEYLFVVQDNVTGCLYPLPRHKVTEPINPTVTIREASSIRCFGDLNGEIFITIADYAGVYDYTVYSSVDLTQTTPITTGSFNTANYPDGNGDDARITGLPGGNFYVTVKATDLPKCGAFSNVANIRSPNGPLTVPSIEIDNVSCDDSSGKIVANGMGGWDSSPYDYRLLIEDPVGIIVIAGAAYTEIAPFGLVNEFDGLSSGTYRVEIRDAQSCENYFEITLAPIDPIIAGIRETQGLICPEGNDAVLEAYDPTSGDSITAAPGASGGVTGSGYKYQLLYLNSNDITDINSRSGLQDTPTFDGVAIGFISAGWYAIEVSSSHKCIGVTLPYYVQPPAPIDPKLVQIRAPGCGGQGQMLLSIENPELGYFYEYRAITAAVTDPFIPIIGTSVIIEGVEGFYQFDVRKVGGAGACTSLRSEGITLVDGPAIELSVNLPDDISCATENDGRIESFSSGGIGNEMYTLYLGNPTPAFSAYTAFNPDPSATIVRGPQSDGTFEGLQEGAYYIGVASGISCWDVKGPLVIIRPEAIVYTISTTAVTCNGETDGSITIEVLSGGAGLVQFAINPNYNEFFSDTTNPGVYTFENLAAGANYEILIQDEQGCGELVPFVTIVAPDVLSISDVVTQPEICLNAYDGQAQLTVTGGTPFVDPLTFASYYETRIEGPGYPVVDPSDPTEGYLKNMDLRFTNLQGGASYRIFVRDRNGCTDDRIINVGFGVDLAATATVTYGCQGIFPNSTVTIQMADNTLFPELMYSVDIDDINTASSMRTFGDLTPGDHVVYIYHSNGCMAQVAFTINEYMPLSLTVTKTGANEITAVAEGGYGNYLYSFQNSTPDSNNIFNLNSDAVVVVKVIDEKGCVAEATLPFDFTTMVEFPNFFTPNGDIMGDTWGPNNAQYFPSIEVKIYDRYGRVVAILDQMKTWDGKYKGRELPTGDYWYVVNANDKSEQRYVGHFTLYR